MLTFYYFPAACSLVTNMALEEAGANYQPVLVDLLGDRSDYYKINPTGKVPAVVADGELLTENVAILYWIAKSYPDKMLLPNSTSKAAKALSFLSWCSNTAHIAYRQSRVPARFTPDQSVHNALAIAGREAYTQALEKVNKMLEKRQWFLGDQFSICDCYATLLYDWGARNEFPMSDFECYTQYINNVLTRPSARKALTMHHSPLI
ncbi:glutathione S-transferase family protein [Pseudomaricurvus alkylphenolicus]|uniref:glutathione S-transferase family protein n=1 Tax=Pseudomaricurvus alkylphenolicus TaxID=1306991 RepID=UPI00141FC97C|nr:glutathione S-transferase family protein [Pseudomaricurvus alkylphenolicus]NIB44455.1 glutathione S-transferase family protein [Pseudomaricurvus alkylphenolicus]